MRPRHPARDLRTAVDCLPLETRRAMLEGIGANRIIVGAYTDRQGGICPMLAAHRNGGRASLVRASVGLEEIPSLGAVAPPRERRTTGEFRAGGGGLGPPRTDAFRAGELRRRAGWAWLRPVRRLDDYERALSDVAVAGPDELELRHDAVGRGA
jgi:hypothetical protein